MAGYADSLGICDRISLLGIRSLYGPVSCPVSCFWAGGDYGGFYGSITDNDPLPCMHDSGVWNQRTACWMVGERICWRMLIWMHTRMSVPTALSYFTAYTIYDNAEILAEASLSFDMMYTFPTNIIICGCYLFSAIVYEDREEAK